MIELACSARLALRPAAPGWQILDKADWSEVGRIQVGDDGRMSHLEIVAERRRQGLGREAFGCLARSFPDAVPTRAHSPAGWLRHLGYTSEAQAPDRQRVLVFSGLPRDEDAEAQASRRCRQLCAELGIPADYSVKTGLPLQLEPDRLLETGTDLSDRPLYLEPRTAQAWLRMSSAAAADQITLQAVSGFRSLGYQAALVRRKLDSGLSVGRILEVSAAPGYSEHHSGRALDLTTPGSATLEEAFEDSAAFGWLTGHAKAFGFAMSYPRHNPHGIAYEPWHWAYQD